MGKWIICMTSLLVVLMLVPSATAQERLKADERDNQKSATENNKRLILRLFQEVVNQRNPLVIDELYEPNVVDHSAFPDQAPGTEGIKNAVRGFLEIFPDLEVTVEDLIAEGDKVATRETWRGIHGPSGKAASGSVMHIFRVSEGRITEEWSQGWDWLEKL